MLSKGQQSQVLRCPNWTSFLTKTVAKKFSNHNVSAFSKESNELAFKLEVLRARKFTTMISAEKNADHLRLKQTINPRESATKLPKQR